MILDHEKIDAVFRKWLARLPHPYRSEHRAAGYRYDLSILQAEFSLTQVLDFPRTGRQLFEDIIRENLDLFFIRAEERFFRVGLAVDSNSVSGRTTRTLAQLGKSIDQLIEEFHLTTKNT